MYAAGRRGSTPTRYLALARATFAEMALAGITLVGEFHYLHHGRGGAPYATRTRWARRWSTAAARGRRPDHAARRLLPARRHRRASSTSVAAALLATAPPTRWVERASSALGASRRRRGSARRSTACAPSTRRASATVAAWAATRGRAAARPRVRAAGRERGVPRRATGARRPRVLADAGALGRALHRRARHPPDRRTTSRSSAPPARRAASARRPSATSPTASARRGACATPARALRLGSDSHAVIDLFEEARAVELDERLATGRARQPPARPRCCGAATAGGYARLGWPDGGRLEPGALADLVTVWPRRRPPRRHRGPSTPLERGGVRGARRPTSRHVMVGGAWRRPRRRATSRSTSPAELAAAIAAVWRVTHARRRRHRPAGHQRPGARRRARSGSSATRRVVIEGDRVVGRRARRRARPTSASTPAGRCVIPGFVDSHTHLVFAGDRADEFAARMAGRALRGRRHPRHDATATRAATDDELARARRGAAATRRCAPASPTSRSSPATGSTSTTRRGCCEVAAELTDDVTFLGAHVVPAEYEGRADAYVALVVRRRCSPRCAPHARWIDVFCERGRVRRRPVAGPCSSAGRAAGLGLRVHANQLGPGPGRAAGGRAGRGLGRPLHVPRPTPTSRRSPAATPSPPSCPATDFSHPPALPRRAPGRSTPGVDGRARHATATRARATRPRCAFCIALAVRDMRMTVDEALAAATLGGARALRRDDLGRLSPGRARRRGRARRAFARPPRLPPGRAAGRSRRPRRPDRLRQPPTLSLSRGMLRSRKPRGLVIRLEEDPSVQ